MNSMMTPESVAAADSVPVDLDDKLVADKNAKHDQRIDDDRDYAHEDVSGNAAILSDVAALRSRARSSLEEGAVTPGYRADKEIVLRLLNEALATEILCTLRYRHHYFVASGLAAESVKEEFLTHAKDEQEHADQIAERIVQLGGDPNFDPHGLTERSHAEYGRGGSLADMIRDDLIAERVAIESYREMIRFIGSDDPTTRRILETVLAKEEEHAEEFASMLSNVKLASQ